MTTCALGTHSECKRSSVCQSAPRFDDNPIRVKDGYVVVTLCQMAVSGDTCFPWFTHHMCAGLVYGVSLPTAYFGPTDWVNMIRWWAWIHSNPRTCF